MTHSHFSPRFARGVLLVVLFSIPIFSGILPKAMAAASPLSLSDLRSIDVMKYTKDVMTEQPSDETIKSLVSTLATLHVDYVAISVPMDPTSAYPAGNVPAPRTAENFTQAWADAIHQSGLHIIWRGTFSGLEGLYGFTPLVGNNRIPAGTTLSASTDGSSTWLGRIGEYITTHPSYFADGDIWAPLPERTEGIFSDSTSFLPSTGPGLQANYANFFSDLKSVSDSAFAKMGKNVITGLTANNASEILSGWLPRSLYDSAGYVAVDYYGMTHTPNELDHDIRAMAAATGKKVFIEEWGDYWNQNMDPISRAAYLSQMYAVIQKLSADGILAGFSYWGGWVNNAEGILTQDASGFHLADRGLLLANFFSANSNTTGDVVLPATITTVPSTTQIISAAVAAPVVQVIAPAAPPSSTQASDPSTVPSLACPGPATNAFTGCYYSGENFGSLLLARTDQSIHFYWADGRPTDTLPDNQFSVRWQGLYTFYENRNYTFTVNADDGFRLFIDGKPIMDEWHDESMYSAHTVSVPITSGQHLVTMEYYQAFGGAAAKLDWQ
jgi:hypothetical protein